MTPEQLKASILQYAIQGKLVEQRLEEGTAEELYKSIQEEKQKLIKEGKIKKEKPLDAIAEDDIPFDIPNTWKWCYLGEIFTHTAGKALNAKNTTGEKHKYITTSNVYWDHFELDNLKEMYYTEDEIEKYSVQYGDLLVLEGGDVGRTAIWDLHISYCIQNHIHRLRPYIEINIKYFYYVMMYLKFRGDIAGKGIGIKGLSANALHCINIPLPPLEEQHRIVAKIEELLPFVDRYAASYEKLEQFNAKFPEDMKKSILQYAIQGKLVEQRPEEGSAEELYKQIQEEKSKLIKEGKIKKEKPLAEITEDEIPFDIPESWKWVRTGSIFSVGTGMTPLKGESKFYEGGTIPWITSTMTSNRFIDKAEVYITDYALESTSLSVYKTHTLLVAMYGQGKTRGQVSELLIPATINQACAALENILDEIVLTRYVYFFYLYNYEILRKKAEGTSQPNLNVGKISSTLIPLPPLEEQKRIVDKIEELLPYCDQLVK